MAQNKNLKKLTASSFERLGEFLEDLDRRSQGNESTR